MVVRSGQLRMGEKGVETVLQKRGGLLQVVGEMVRLGLRKRIFNCDLQEIIYSYGLQERK